MSDQQDPTSGPPPLDGIELRHAGPLPCIELLDEDIDPARYQELDGQIRRIIEAAPGHEALINFRRVRFFPTTALGAMVAIQLRYRRTGGGLILTDLVDPLREIFQITRLEHVFAIFDTEAQAIRQKGLDRPTEQ